MKNLRLLAPALLLALAHLGACTYPTRVQVENTGKTATKITVRSADGSFRHDFPELQPGETSEEIEFEGGERDVDVNGSDNHENGFVDLESGRLNIIQLHEDGIEPTVRVVEE